MRYKTTSTQTRRKEGKRKKELKMKEEVKRSRHALADGSFWVRDGEHEEPAASLPRRVARLSHPAVGDPQLFTRDTGKKLVIHSFKTEDGEGG